MSYPTVSSYAKAYVRTRATAHMKFQISIFPFQGNETRTIDPVTGRVQNALGALAYAGKARIWTVDSGGLITVGEDVIATQSTNCSVPWNAPHVPLGYIIRVDNMPSDEVIPSIWWRVTSVSSGGLIDATQRFGISAWQPSQAWEDEL